MKKFVPPTVIAVGVCVELTCRPATAASLRGCSQRLFVVLAVSAPALSQGVRLT